MTDVRPITKPPADASSKISPWYKISGPEVLNCLRSSEKGLTESEALQRLTKNGPNALNEAEPVRVYTLLLGQFKSLIIWILIIAGIISGLLGEALDAIAILAIVVLNALIGFYQEWGAEKSIAALKKMTAPQAKVRRDGSVKAIAASQVVVGDILELEAGDLVAADARLLEAYSLHCSESTLTGESEAVPKQSEALPLESIPLGDQINLVFMGTTVSSGKGVAVVVATGMETQLGHIAQLIESAQTDTQTPLQKKLEGFGRLLVWATLGIVALLFLLGFLRGTPLFEMFLTSVSLAVAAVPEGLPAVVTVSLSLGVLRMARRGALMRKLAAVETLGATTVICTDKTGTLTVGEMTARSLKIADKTYEVTGEGFEPTGEILSEGKKVTGDQHQPLNQLTHILIGCNNARLTQAGSAWTAVGDPTEIALLQVAIKAGINPTQFAKEFPIQHEFPFDSDRKRSTVIRKLPNGRSQAFTNGAPDGLLQKCTHLYTEAGIREITAIDTTAIQTQISTLSKKSLRVLGSAYRELEIDFENTLTPDLIEQKLVFVGLTGMYDAPRPEAKAAILECHNAGIRVVMITGDHPNTAAAIAEELNIVKSPALVVSGTELESMTDAELQSRVEKIHVYARVTAGHKLRIVQALKANQDIVAMTGDGVNDAPAIKGADIGIAMGKSGTEVTKQAADMIITDDNFSTIVAAVEEGRGIYDNIRKTLQYLLAGNSGELLFMATSLIAGLPAPLLPIHLLWINLVTDGLPALCLAADPIDKEVMRRKPRGRSESMTNPRFLKSMILTGFLTAGISFAVYLFVLQSQGLVQARVSAFAVLVFAELFRAFGARSEFKPVWRISLFSNTTLLAVVSASIFLQLWSQHNEILGRFLKSVTLPMGEGLILLALGTLPMLVLELVKVFEANQHRSKNPPLGGSSELTVLLSKS